MIVFHVCEHACICVIILTPLFIGMCKVSIIITSYMQCVIHTAFGIFFLCSQYVPCQNLGVQPCVQLDYNIYYFFAVLWAGVP
jgi:hypothetical protein